MCSDPYPKFWYRNPKIGPIYCNGLKTIERRIEKAGQDKEQLKRAIGRGDQGGGRKHNFFVAKRKLKNYRLKHSRLHTCYSSLLYLLAIYSAKDTVSIEDAATMVHLTPTERLEWILGQGHCASSHAKITELPKSYETFYTAPMNQKRSSSIASLTVNRV
jgi:hypothetical protein